MIQLRIRLYDMLLSKFKDTTVFQEDASRLIQSIPIPLSFLNEINCERCRTAPCRHVTSSLADHFIASAVEYMVYESGFETVSVECIRTLSQVMRSCIHNLGRVLSSSVLSFPTEEGTSTHSQRRYVFLFGCSPLVQSLFVAGQFPDEQANAAVCAPPVYAGTVECLQPTEHGGERAVETVPLCFYYEQDVQISFSILLSSKNS